MVVCGFDRLGPITLDVCIFSFRNELLFRIRFGSSKVLLIFTNSKAQCIETAREPSENGRHVTSCQNDGPSFFQVPICVSPSPLVRRVIKSNLFCPAHL